MENHHFYWENSLQMAIFNSYVKLPEGKPSTYSSGKNHYILTSTNHRYEKNSHTFFAGQSRF